MVLRTILRGAAAGALGTALMTPFQLIGLEPRSRLDRNYWMPRRVFAGVARRTGLAQHADQDEKTALASGAHVAYGAAGGALYALWRRRSGGSLISGVAFGLAVWALSYAEVLPAARIVPPPDELAGAQNARLLAAHVVYGATLGLATGRGARGEGNGAGPYSERPARHLGLLAVVRLASLPSPLAPFSPQWLPAALATRSSSSLASRIV